MKPKKNAIVALAIMLSVFLLSMGLSIGMFIQDFSSTMVIEDVLYANNLSLIVDDFMEHPNPSSGFRRASIAMAIASGVCFLGVWLYSAIKRTTDIN